MRVECVRGSRTDCKEGLSFAPAALQIGVSIVILGTAFMNNLAESCRRSLACLMTTVLALPVLTAAEYRGTVKVGALPVPGVSLMAIQGDKRVVTTTDEQG